MSSHQKAFEPVVAYAQRNGFEVKETSKGHVAFLLNGNVIAITKRGTSNLAEPRNLQRKLERAVHLTAS